MRKNHRLRVVTGANHTEPNRSWGAVNPKNDRSRLAFNSDSLAIRIFKDNSHRGSQFPVRDTVEHAHRAVERKAVCDEVRKINFLLSEEIKNGNYIPFC